VVPHPVAVPVVATELLVLLLAPVAVVEWLLLLVPLLPPVSLVLLCELLLLSPPFERPLLLLPFELWLELLPLLLDAPLPLSLLLLSSC
jgi:hypothetical protein